MQISRPISPASALCHDGTAGAETRSKPDKKKIFIFCDGTGNEFADRGGEKDANSNVVKLYTTLRVNDAQLAYYHPGVGTMGDPTIRHALPRFWSKVKGLAFGNGFKANVLDAYRFLMEFYADGDDIYIFGFSRGAYTARALAGMLHGYGLLCRGNEGHLLYAWNMFHDAVSTKRQFLKKPFHKRGGASSHTIQPNFSFAQTFSRQVTIRFMGIWDTVSSVGWIYEPLRLLDMAQNPIVRVGRHAVSIDERRAYYRDNLWGPPIELDAPEWPQALRDQGIKQDMVQVWFPGVHSDVGGSYPQKEAAPANEALVWMIDEVVRNGAELCRDRIDMVLGHPSGIHAADQIYAPPPKPAHCIHDSLKHLWWALQLFPQQYYDKEDQKIQWRVPYGAARHIPREAIIHGSAVRRMDATTKGELPYHPRNLLRAQLQPLQSPVSGTTANLEGCFVYRPNAGEDLSSYKKTVRIAQLAMGTITLALTFLIVAMIARCLLCGLLHLLSLSVRLAAHTPGLKGGLRW
jgi:uncharacterized protein (DUF2235 family)